MTPPFSPLSLAAYWLICRAAGLWSHFTFICPLIGFIVLTARLSIRRQLALHLVPLAIAALTYFGFIRHLHIAGGPASDTVSALAAMISMLGGGPWLPGPLTTLTAACCAIPFLLLLWPNRKNPLYLAAAAACLTALATVMLKTLAFGHADIIFPRYFLLPITFAGLVLTFEVATNLELGLRHRRPALFLPFAAITLTVLTFAALDTAQLLTQSRGQYLAPLRTIAQSPQPTLSSDYDSRTQRLLSYYKRFLPNKILYATTNDPTPTRWFLLNTATNIQTPPPALTHNNAPYQLRKTYPHFGPSGWSWSLYERQ